MHQPNLHETFLANEIPFFYSQLKLNRVLVASFHDSNLKLRTKKTTPNNLKTHPSYVIQKQRPETGQKPLRDRHSTFSDFPGFPTSRQLWNLHTTTLERSEAKLYFYTGVNVLTVSWAHKRKEKGKFVENRTPFEWWYLLFHLLGKEGDKKID